MTINEINNAISKLNPFTDKAELKALTKERRRLQRIADSVNDVLAGDVPAMLRNQSGV